MQTIQAWQMQQVNQPMTKVKISPPVLSTDEVLVRVTGCGVCHTDLGFFYDGVRTIQAPPLTLGHEISGFVEKAGAECQQWAGKAVIVPAVLPCGECALCRKGRGTICRKQKMPGNHLDGGFASHVVVPGRYLCEVEVANDSDLFGQSGVTIKELSVIADAVTTPYQAAVNSNLSAGDLAIFIGVGGIGGFGVQVAKALGAKVVAVDVDDRRLQSVADYGADVTFNPRDLEPKALRKAIQEFVENESLSPYEWKVFETSGAVAGQELAFGLLTFGATLNVVGFTMEKLSIRLSNLMAFDARAIGNWGCHPKFYPQVLELIKTGKIQLAPFVQTFPLSEINAVFERVHHRELDKRAILIPDFE
ncbi:MAG: 6-hydroxycyclohex-1-ene-1-carbonyl-CoA dehydrogenase [bacterium]